MTPRQPDASGATHRVCLRCSLLFCYLCELDSMESIAQRTTDVYEQLLQREIPNRDAEFNCGRSYLEAERADLAEEVFRRLLEAGYKSQDSRFRLAESLFAQCRYVEAKKELIKLLQDEPDHADALEFLTEFQRHVNRGGTRKQGRGRDEGTSSADHAAAHGLAHSESEDGSAPYVPRACGSPTLPLLVSVMAARVSADVSRGQAGHLRSARPRCRPRTVDGISAIKREWKRSMSGGAHGAGSARRCRHRGTPLGLSTRICRHLAAHLGWH